MQGRTKAALVAAAVSLATAVAAAPASAATVRPMTSCSGYGCDGHFPDSSGCASSAITAEQAPLEYNGTVMGYIQLRYSTACRTVWARIISYTDPGSELANVVRNSDHAYESCDTDLWSSTLGAYSCYTAMLYDGGVTSYANGELYVYTVNPVFASTASY